MTFECQVTEINWPDATTAARPRHNIVEVTLQAEHDYTFYQSNLFLKLRPEDAANIRLKQRFVLTAVDESPESESNLVPSAVNLP